MCDHGAGAGLAGHGHDAIMFHAPQERGRLLRRDAHVPFQQRLARAVMHDAQGEGRGVRIGAGGDRTGGARSGGRRGGGRRVVAPQEARDAGIGAIGAGGGGTARGGMQHLYQCRALLQRGDVAIGSHPVGVAEPDDQRQGKLPVHVADQIGMIEGDPVGVGAAPVAGQFDAHGVIVRDILSVLLIQPFTVEGKLPLVRTAGDQADRPARRHAAVYKVVHDVVHDRWLRGACLCGGPQREREIEFLQQGLEIGRSLLQQEVPAPVCNTVEVVGRLEIRKIQVDCVFPRQLEHQVYELLIRQGILPREDAVEEAVAIDVHGQLRRPVDQRMNQQAFLSLLFLRATENRRHQICPSVEKTACGTACPCRVAMRDAPRIRPWRAAARRTAFPCNHARWRDPRSAARRRAGGN
ncbi:hypothetical protein KMAL_30810 [Novacetimonas maltaceti]|uniref:Uncharacterized protein n=1 Tax=Novacetimonas maltaceti TaxID=1203393 RepID=A0A2S3VXG1_9PROT|nr:hypothetical protein KMAL_30810 [Novacetimonas maltaceti]